MSKARRLGGQFKPKASRNRERPDPSFGAPDRRADKAARNAPNEEASLADLFIATTHETKWGKRVADVLLRYRIWMRHSHRFILTDEFTTMATTMSFVSPQKLLTRLQYATLPYDTTWIEFDLHAKMRVVHAAKGSTFDPEGVSPRLGLLLQRISDTSFVCTLVGISSSGTGAVLPNMTCYYISTEGVDKFPRIFGCTPIAEMPQSDPMGAEDKILSKATLWGYLEEVEASLADEKLRVPEFLYRHGAIGSSAVCLPLMDRLGYVKSNVTAIGDNMIEELREFTGTARWLVTVLAMLNEVPISTEQVVPTGYQRAGRLGRNKLLDYHKVSLVLPKKNPVKWLHKRLTHEEIRRRRAHEVRAHWRTYLHEQHCGYEEHDWEYDHENGYRLCGKCEAYGRLIHEHIRGDANLGWVQKEYVVKAAP